MANFWQEIAAHIASVTGRKFAIATQRSVGGGCINEGHRIEGAGQIYFVKLNRPNQSEMFAAEALGLQQMGATQSILVPQPLCWGETQSNSYIVMDWLELGSGGSGSWQEMGRQLAQMHKAGGSEQFGWERNNTIGSTPQINTWCDSWAEFWAETRIGYQIRLANRHGGGFPEAKKVAACIRKVLADIKPKPALVHGDLWSGNAAIASDGSPVIFDPAAYYGDREVDIAMTELFGGFPPSFYRGYEEVWPLEQGYGDRKDLYNLYHILNHFNLFGGGYGSQAKRMLQRFM